VRQFSNELDYGKGKSFGFRFKVFLHLQRAGNDHRNGEQDTDHWSLTLIIIQKICPDHGRSFVA
jgi:hypothetical protein